ncbi:MAG: isoamylase early set domain-containing protein [Gemmatimonadaceae bacterium]
MHDEERDELIERVAHELKAPIRLSPSLERRVMSAIAEGDSRARPATGAGALPSAWRWLRRPRALMVSPLTGLALAAGIAAIAVLSARGRDRGGGLNEGAVAAAVAPGRTDTVRLVQFVLVRPTASTVELVGDFNDWDVGTTPMHRVSPGGVWSVDVRLAAGRYTYTFVVDGTEWVADPAAPPAVDDDFGRPGSVIIVGESST